MFKITITSNDIREMKGTGKTSGKPYHIRIQTGYAYTTSKDGVVSEFPDKFEILLEEGQIPYARGHYQLSPSALYVSREGRLEVAPRLVPLPAGKA
jgi:hypothetical protein